METDFITGGLTHPGNLRVALVVPMTLLCLGCVPTSVSTAPKMIYADGATYTACEGFIMVYQPSRDIADSSGKLYEITFTDDYGKAADLKDIEHYTIRKRESGETLSYAIPDGLPSTEARARSAQHFDFSQLYGEKGGQVWPPTRAGAVLLFGNKGGDEGRAKWLSPGKWERVPCSFSGTSGQFVGPLERLGR